MVLYDHCSIQILYPRVLIPATVKVIKPRPCRIYRQKTGSSFRSANCTRSKVPFLCSGNKLQIFKYPPFEQTLCIDTYRINFFLSKNGIARQYYIPLEKEHYDIGTHLDFCQENDISITTLLAQQKQCCNKVVTTLVFGCSNDVGNTTL